MKTKELIKMKIENDISAFEKIGIKNNHGMSGKNIRNYISEPKYEEYIEATDNLGIMLWTVLEEPNSGYLIVYHEEFGEFGLALKTNDNKRIFLGIYGNFVETFSSM